MGQHAVYQKANAQPHRAVFVQGFIQEDGINRVDWPAYSPNLNPVQTLWDELQRRVRDKPPSRRRAATVSDAAGRVARDASESLHQPHQLHVEAVY